MTRDGTCSERGQSCGPLILAFATQSACTVDVSLLRHDTSPSVYETTNSSLPPLRISVEVCRHAHSDISRYQKGPLTLLVYLLLLLF